MKTTDTMPAGKQLQRSLTNIESPNQIKWGKPAFQAFQLRPWNKDSETEEALKNPLGIYGPQSQIELGRAKSVPPKHSKDNFVDREDVRTAHSVANMCDGSISLKPKSSLEALPTRPPLSKMKQIPGRYFPKPTPIEVDRLAHFGALRRNKHAIRIKNYDRPTGNSKSMDMNDLPIESVSFLDVLPNKSLRQKSPGFHRLFHRMKTSHTEFPEIRSEVFAICFNANDSCRKGGDHVSSTLHVSNEANNGNNNSNANGQLLLKATNHSFDPNSELRSDYYTIKRISVTSQSSRAPSRSFSVVLRGHPKRLHPKLMSETGFDLGDDNPQPKTSKSASSSLTGAPGMLKETTVESERPSESTKPSEPRPPAKIEVKIDNPITINGIS